MFRSYDELSIKGQNGERIPVKDCNLDPLNLLIPGRAPILVPKDKARSKLSNKKPKSSKDDGHGKLKVKLVIPATDDDDDDEDASTGYEGDRDDEGYLETSPLINKAKKGIPKKKENKKKGSRSSADSVPANEQTICKKKESSRSSHCKHADNKEQHEQDQQQKLQARIDKQQAYIARLRAKYEARAAQAKKPTATKAPSASPAASSSAGKQSKKTDTAALSSSCSSSDAEKTPTTNDDNESSDASTSVSAQKVREMIKNLKIKAAGTSNNNNNGEPFTPSEDAQLLVRKKANESWKDIVAAMGRPKKQLQNRLKELQEQGVQAPGSDSDDGGDAKGGGGGGTTTETETGGDDNNNATTTGGAETTTDDDDVENDGENKKKKKSTGGGGDAALDVSALFGALEAIAEANTSPVAAAAEREEHPPKGNNNNKSKKESKKASASPPAPKSQNNNSNSGDSNNQKNQGGNKKQKQEKGTKNKHAKVQGPTNNDEKGEENNDDDEDGDDDDEEGGVKAYIAMYARHLLNEANAGRTRIPEPDENFDQNDCLLLALTALHRHQNHWLGVQADFANMTGRLVPEDVLKHKLRGGSSE